VEGNLSPLICRVPFSCCGIVATPQATAWAPAWASDNLLGRKRATMNLLPSTLLLLRQRRVAAGNSLGIGLGTKIKNVRACR